MSDVNKSQSLLIHKSRVCVSQWKDLCSNYISIRLEFGRFYGCRLWIMQSVSPFRNEDLALTLLVYHAISNEVISTSRQTVKSTTGAYIILYSRFYTCLLPPATTFPLKFLACLFLFLITSSIMWLGRALMFLALLSTSVHVPLSCNMDSSDSVALFHNLTSVGVVFIATSSFDSSKVVISLWIRLALCFHIDFQHEFPSVVGLFVFSFRSSLWKCIARGWTSWCGRLWFLFLLVVAAGLIV